MNQDSFPIASPSEELVLKWDSEWHAAKVKHMNYANYIATQAARWGAYQQLKLDAERINKAWQKGADQELEACCECINDLAHGADAILVDLRAARRPKPPSLKEQALTQLDSLHTALAEHEPELEPTLREEFTMILNEARCNSTGRVIGNIELGRRLVKAVEQFMCAQPESEGPTDDELFAVAEAYAEDNGLIGLHNAPDFARAVLARWGK